MSTEPEAAVPPRRAIAVTAVAVAACFLIFLGVLAVAYLPHWRGTTMQTLYTPQEVAKMVQERKIEESEAWRYTLAGRTARLTELRGKEQTGAASYAWLDQANGVVRLPVDRAMELIIQEQEASR